MEVRFFPDHRIAQLAVETCLWPLYEVDHGKWNITGESKRIAEGKKEKRPVVDWIKSQGRFKHLLDPKWSSVVDEIQWTSTRSGTSLSAFQRHKLVETSFFSLWEWRSSHFFYKDGMNGGKPKYSLGDILDHHRTPGWPSNGKYAPKGDGR